LIPDERHTWLIPENADTYAAFLPIGSKETKSAKAADVQAIFKNYGRGVATSRDDVAYDFNRKILTERIKQFIEDYNSEVDRYRRSGNKTNPDSFVKYDRIKWSRDLKQDLQRGRYAEFSEKKIRTSLYRPFCKQHLFFDRVLNEEVYVFPQIFPTPAIEQENRVIIVSDIGYRASTFSAIISDLIPELHLCASTDSHQCFPFYVYDEDGTNRRENITDWALTQFRTHYRDASISKWDIFYYVYGLLHHPGYRTTFADNLKRELPRIPFAPDFRAFVEAGRKLADLHLNYETVAPYNLRWIEAKDTPLSYRVEKMRLNKDKTALAVNNSLTLADIPPEVYQYRLGNRSALEWVIDQYQVSADKRSGITSDPNRADDPRYIVDLVGRVVAVSVETVRIVNALPEQCSA
ncbi:MAG: DNA helicase, partial [Anaerolineae bacterium]|nr:DNA helicase [Anaerolineae bacterium]